MTKIEAKVQPTTLTDAVAKGGTATPRTPGALNGRIVIDPGFDELPPDIASAFGMDGSVLPI